METSPSRDECGYSNETSLNENQSKFNNDSNGGENHDDNKQSECYIIGTTMQDENQQSEVMMRIKMTMSKLSATGAAVAETWMTTTSRMSTAVTVVMEVKMMTVILKSWRIFWRKE